MSGSVKSRAFNSLPLFRTVPPRFTFKARQPGPAYRSWRINFNFARLRRFSFARVYKNAEQKENAWKRARSSARSESDAFSTRGPNVRGRNETGRKLWIFLTPVRFVIIRCHGGLIDRSYREDLRPFFRRANSPTAKSGFSGSQAGFPARVTIKATTSSYYYRRNRTLISRLTISTTASISSRDFSRRRDSSAR